MMSLTLEVVNVYQKMVRGITAKTEGPLLDLENTCKMMLKGLLGKVK